MGAYTFDCKFGRIIIFDKNYAKDGEWPYPDKKDSYITHVMPSYVLAVAIREYVSTGKSHSIAILCPVDVDVYDSTNTLVGRIRNNVVDETVTTIPMYVWDDEKYLLLPANTKYSLKLSAFDEGTMEYYVAEANSDDELAKRYKGFVNVELTTDKQMNSTTGGSISVPNTRLYVTDDSELKTAAIQTDGTEIPLGLWGDVNLDGKVDLADSLLISNYAAGRVVLTAEQLLAADVNGDGSVKLDDSLLLCNYIAGRFEMFPVEQ